MGGRLKVAAMIGSVLALVLSMGLDVAGAEKSEIAKVNLLAVGDIMMHSPQIPAGKTATGYNFDSFFSYIAPTLAKGDLVLGNLETTLSGPKTGYTGYPTFNSPDAYADALKKAHFDVLTTANNHCLDRREAGLVRTIEQLDKRGILHTGTFTSAKARGKALLVERNGITFGVLAYTYGTNSFPLPAGKPYSVNLIDKAVMTKDIQVVKKAGADMVVVALHFGNEYQRKPSVYQKDNVNAVLQAGADIVLGSHPHVVQPYEVRTVKASDGASRKAVVIYSLGNFISNQHDPYTDIGGVLSVNVEKRDDVTTIASARFIPTKVYTYWGKQRRVYNVLPMAETLKKRNYAPFSNAQYNALNTAYKEIMNHVQSKP